MRTPDGHPGRLRALVLRTTAYRDNDLIVDLLTDGQGRVGVMARGARKSRKRYGGALELGTRLAVELSTRGRGLPSLSSCDVVAPVLHIRADLDCFHHLAYALELARLMSTEGESDPRGYALAAGYVDHLEAHGATDEALAAWELKMLAHHGYGLRLDACVISGGVPDGLSLRHGGAVDRRRLAPGDALPVPTAVLGALAALGRGEQGRIGPADRAGVRGLFERIWSEITGVRLRTARFLVGGLL